MAEEDKYNLVQVALAAHKTPEFKEDRSKAWILYGTDDDWRNRWGDYLIELFNRSSKHNALICGKRDYITGTGITLETGAEDARLKTINSFESFHEVLRKAALDLELFGGICLRPIWKQGGGLASLSHVDFSKVRVGKDGGFFFSPDWSKISPELEPGFKSFGEFDPQKPGTNELLYFKLYRPNMGAYPLPEYMGALPYCEMDAEISNFHLNNIKNGFWGSMLINFYNGQPTEEEKKKIEKMVAKKAQGSDNAGRWLLNFSDGKERSADVTTLMPPDFDKMFLQLNEQVREEIFIGHRITSPMLFGVKTPGQLGGRTELIEAYELFKKTYVQPKQEMLLQLFNPLLALMGIPPVKIVELTPITEQFSEGVIAQALPPQQLTQIVQKQLGLEEQSQQFSDVSPELAIELFKKAGVPRKRYEVVRAREYFGQQSFAADTDAQILDLYRRNPLITVGEVAKALEVTKQAAQRMVGSLERRGALDSGVVTGEGEKIIEKQVIEFEVLYSYEWRRGFSDADIETSRPFCRELLQLDRLYTRGEIDLISTIVGRNVWEFRGGWYRIPGTDQNRPSCRHVWMQNIVTLK